MLNITLTIKKIRIFEGNNHSTHSSTIVTIHPHSLPQTPFRLQPEEASGLYNEMETFLSGRVLEGGVTEEGCDGF